MKKKKRVPILYLLIFAFFIGVIHSFLVYTGYLEKFITGVKLIPFYLYPLYLIFSFYVTLTIHELAHLLAFKCQKVDIRALYLTMFVFYKKQDKIKFSIKPKLWILFGGLVVPDIGEIYTDKDYDELRKKFAITLIAAPIATITFLILTIIIFILSVFVFNSPLLIGFIFVFGLFTTIWSFLYYLTFNLHTQTLYGDFVAYRLMMKDDLFALSQISQYTMFSSKEDKKRDTFLFHKIENVLLHNELNQTIFTQMLITYYIHGILYDHLPINETIYDKLLTYSKRLYARDEHALTTAYELSYYFYYLKNPDQAMTIFDKIQKNLSKKIDHKTQIYLKNKSEHKLNIHDHHLFLSVKENIDIGQLWIFESLLDPYELEIKSQEPLPFVEYSCLIPIEAE